MCGFSTGWPLEGGTSHIAAVRCWKFRIALRENPEFHGSLRRSVVEGARPDRLCRMAKKKPASRKRKKPALKKRTTVKKAAARRTLALRKKPARTKSRSARTPTGAIRKRSPLLTSLDAATGSRRRGARSAGQSGDLQGLSGAAEADSESVEELLEEGQAFEAGVVSGVEEADAGRGEVRTKEVPEDDVPLEYLDKD
jgi:hypothetical protein